MVFQRTGGGYRVFCNPPYGRAITDWVEKAYREGTKDNTIVVMLIPARTDTRYFHDFIQHRSEIRFVKGRLKFGNSKQAAPWKVLQDCLSTYRTECKINSLTKTIDIYEQIGSDRGRYFIEGLNLKKLTVTSDTYDFYTRLIPLGKDGIGIEWLGKPYLENYQYSSKIKTYVWSDERYTNTTIVRSSARSKAF